MALGRKGFARLRKRNVVPRRMRGRRGGRRKRMWKSKIHRTIGQIDEAYLMLPYVDTYLLNAAAEQRYDWRLNSVFDPDSSGTGHQPRSYDQYALLFSKYTVMAVKVAFTFTNQLATEGCRIVLQTGLTVSGAQTFASFPQELPRASFVKLGNRDSGSAVKKIKRYYSMAKLFGHTRAAIKIDDELSALTISNPARIQFLQLSVQSDSGVTVNSLIVDAKFKFYVRMFERKRVSPS